jgi:hypothetical protein
MSVVGILITAGTMTVLVAFGWLIDERGAVDLIAGYQDGDLPPERERELARDVRNVLAGSAVLCTPLLVHFAVRPLPEPVLAGVPTGGILLLTAWLLWKHNDI